MENIKQMCVLKGSSCVSVLKLYSDLVEEAKIVMLTHREKGLLLNSVFGQSILLSIIQAYKPEILNSRFRCSKVCLIFQQTLFLFKQLITLRNTFSSSLAQFLI